MKAPDFAYARPEGLDAALALLAEHGGAAAPLAGGQSLMPMMNFRLSAPEVLIDLAGCGELRGIGAAAGGGTVIGAMTRYRDLMDWPDLAARLPLLACALPHVAHDAIRNRGTIGGSLALADPAAEMPAVMVALGAEIELASVRGRRRVAAEAFFHGFYGTAREEDELLVAVHVPPAPAATGFHEIVQRHGDYAMAGVALAAGGLAPLRGLRAAFFGIAGAPVLLTDAEGLEAALEGVDLLDDTKASAAMRRHLAGVALTRALAEAG